MLFRSRYDDFYLSLMHRCLSILKQGNFNNQSDDLIAISKGLEIYSLERKRDVFSGVNQSNNILFASAFYYLSDYSASAWILSKIYPFEHYESAIDIFISGFLKRTLSSKYDYTIELQKFLESGNFEILEVLKKKIRESSEVAFTENSYEYSSFLLANAILEKFSTENIWYDLLQNNDNIEYWKPLVSQYIKKKVDRKSVV